MGQLQLPVTTTRHQYVQLGGGLDQLTPVLQLKPGVVRDGQNYECSITGGYSRIAGYERCDGRAAPSAAVYQTITVEQLVPVFAGATITGATSGASGTVLYSEFVGPANLWVIAYTQSTGPFADGENLLSPGVVANNVQSGGNGAARDFDATMRSLAANVYRALIGAVPGAGPIRGGFFYKGSNYAFRDSGTTLALYKATTGGWALVAGVPAMLQGGRVQTDLGNFGGITRVYGCDSVNPGWVFDGVSFTQIATGNVPDVPDNVLVHKEHLWFSFVDNVQCSSIADPMTWSAITGSASFRCEAPVTSLQRQPGSQSGGAMSISTEQGTEMLYGNSAADFQKVSFEQSAGARLYGVQRLGGQTFAFGNIGVFALSTTQAFGNFAPASMTMKIRPFTQTRRTQCTASLVNKEKSQYRIFFGDGFGLYMTVLNGKLVGSMPVFFPDAATCSWQGESDDGSEASYFGGANGRVFQLDAGTSCDGAAIEAYLVLPFNNQQQPRGLKRYRRATFEVQGDAYAEFVMTYEVNYGGLDRPQGTSGQVAPIDLRSAMWDSAVTWDSPITWDGKTLLPDTLELSGTGENLAIRIDSLSEKFDSYTLNSVVLDYSQRREMRATK